jgi:hypothetical protein
MLAVVLPLQANAVSPLDALQIRMKSLLDVLRDPSFKALPTQVEKKEKLLPIIDEMFDYNELSGMPTFRTGRRRFKSSKRPSPNHKPKTKPHIL